MRRNERDMITNVYWYRVFQSITVNFVWTIHDRASTQLDVSCIAVIVIHLYFFHTWQHLPLWCHSKWLRHFLQSRILELCNGFCKQIRLSQSGAGSKTSTSARKHQQGIRWRRWWSSFAQLGMWQARKEAGASHVFARPTLMGPLVRVWLHLQHGSLCDSLPQKMRYRLRQHDAYSEPIYACILTRPMSDSLWQLCAEKNGQGLRRNSVIACSRTLKDSVQQCSPSSAWTEREDQGKSWTGHKRNAHPCCREPCIKSSSGSRAPTGSHRACHPQRYPYVKF
jgi:hypothetical protein